uniref:Pentacotripeptide-repeat region of PRORP domain-containing protein n=1 Tax=Oryza punctata TaxID=4537 RepID=A0A0E0KZK5_ORYPU
MPPPRRCLVKAAAAADAVSHNTLVAGYCRDGRLADAERVLDAANVVTYTALIDGYCRSGRLDDALRLIASMPVAPDAYTYSIVLKGLCIAKKWEEAEELMAEMIRNRCPPNEVTFATQIRSFCQNGLLDRAVQLLDQMPRYGCTPDVVIYSTHVNGFSEQGHVDEALELLNTMLCKPNTVCYNAALKALCIAERWEDIGGLMVRKGCLPNEATFSMLISSLCQNNLVDSAVEVLEQMEKYGCEPDTVNYNIIIN